MELVIGIGLGLLLGILLYGEFLPERDVDSGKDGRTNPRRSWTTSPGGRLSAVGRGERGGC